MDDKFLKPYRPADCEDAIYKKWEDSGYFNPDNLPERHKEPYAIIMPPANANGRLHAGHGMDVALKDTIIRFRRMQGYKTLYLPGADHAGFETQIVYERQLEKEGRTRFDLKPEQLYKEILQFTLENKQYMENDVRKLGTSCDWSREKFTLDDDVVAQVQKTFKKMYDDGLVYRGSRIINWCAKHQTSLSDVETEFKEQADPFYYIKYGPFTIATSRPETKFGDKYVVMHPDDDRYKEYKHGQKIELEWINGPITATVIKDDAIDMEMGSGVMTITPWHSAVDFEIAERHGLDKEQIIDFKGKLLPIAKEFEGIHIKKARALIVEKLKEKGLLVKVDEEYKHSVNVCYKCSTIIEPQIKDQWFVKMKPLADMAMKPVRDGKIVFKPKYMEKIFFHWMENTIDWNISRQIVWGIPIPAKLCDVCKDGVPDLDGSVTTCKKCKGPLRDDPDTFDTWFSSGQWPLVTLNYPDHNDFKTYYPTDLMETGNDLIFKWVPRMIMFGMYLANEIPFKTVYFHGMVNDEHNKKMSKSKGNVVSPIELSDKFGTDAFRMALLVGTTAGTDMALQKDKIKAYKHFANKVWNVTRFILTQTEGVDFSEKSAKKETDKKLLNEIDDMTKEVTTNLENYNLHISAEKLYHYIWHRFADEILEESKPILMGDDEEAKLSRQHTLYKLLRTSLKLLHPFMPFVTEEIWSSLPHKETELLMVAEWPE